MHTPRAGDVFAVGNDVRCFEGVGKSRHEGKVWYSRPEPREGERWVRGRWMSVEAWRRWLRKAEFVEHHDRGTEGLNEHADNAA